MTSDEAVRLTRAYIESLFPKECSNCGRRYASLAAYLKETHHVGEPISYDAEGGDWTPREPIGTLSLANCRCGNTLAISSAEMRVPTFLRLMAWAQLESLRRGVSPRQLLAWVRAEIDRRVLGEAFGKQPHP